MRNDVTRPRSGGLLEAAGAVATGLGASRNRQSAGTARLWVPLASGAVLALLVMAAAFALRPGAEQGWLFATRWTARLALVLFVSAYLLRAVPWRQRLGLAFAGAHLVHAAMFIVYITSFDIQRGVVSTVGGTIGYVVLLAMVMVTFVPTTRAPVLRRWGMTYLWSVFAFSYLGRVLEAGERQGEGWFGLIMLATVPVIWLLRGGQSMLERRRTGHT